MEGCYEHYCDLRRGMEDWLKQSRRMDPPSLQGGGEDEANYRKVIGERHEFFGQAVVLAAVRQDDGLMFRGKLENLSALFFDGIAMLFRMDLDADTAGQSKHLLGLCERVGLQRIDHHPLAKFRMLGNKMSGVFIAAQGIRLVPGHEGLQRRH